MYGNLIDVAVGQAGQGRSRLAGADPHGAVMSRCSTTYDRPIERRGPHERDDARPGPSRDQPCRLGAPPGWLRDPWRKPRILQAVTWGYLVVVDGPVTDRDRVLVQRAAGPERVAGFAFGGGARTRSTPSGTTRRSRSAMFQTPASVGDHDGDRRAAGRRVRDRDRPVARAAGNGRNFLMLLSFVMPEIVLGISLFLRVLEPVEGHPSSGRRRRCSAWSRSRSPTRSSSSARDYLRSAGSTRRRRWIWVRGRPRRSVACSCRCSYPAILASAALVFADTIDDFVTVRYLSGPATVRAAVREDLQLRARSRRRRP